MFGAQFSSGRAYRVVYFWHMVGNRFLTLLSNMLTNLTSPILRLVIKSFDANSGWPYYRGGPFGVEAEIVAKIGRTGARIYEVDISYYGRTYAQWEKIGWKDGIAAIYAILKYNLFRRVWSDREKKPVVK